MSERLDAIIDALTAGGKPPVITFGPTSGPKRGEVYISANIPSGEMIQTLRELGVIAEDETQTGQPDAVLLRWIGERIILGSAGETRLTFLDRSNPKLNSEQENNATTVA
jgi:hypothetical protein